MEENTFIPLAKGEVNIPLGPPKVTLPWAKIVRAHIMPLTQDKDSGVSLVNTTDFAGKPEQKIVVRFTCDSSVKDRLTGEDLLGKSFSQWLPYKNTPKSSLGQLRIAALGRESTNTDPTDLAGKMVQIIIKEDFFDGKKYDRFTYMAPDDDQTIPSFADNYPTDAESDIEMQAAIDKVFAGEK